MLSTLYISPSSMALKVKPKTYSIPQTFKTLIFPAFQPIAKALERPLTSKVSKCHPPNQISSLNFISSPTPKVSWSNKISGRSESTTLQSVDLFWGPARPQQLKDIIFLLPFFWACTALNALSIEICFPSSKSFLAWVCAFAKWEIQHLPLGVPTVAFPSPPEGPLVQEQRKYHESVDSGGDKEEIVWAKSQ